MLLFQINQIYIFFIIFYQRKNPWEFFSFCWPGFYFLSFCSTNPFCYEKNISCYVSDQSYLWLFLGLNLRTFGSFLKWFALFVCFWAIHSFIFRFQILLPIRPILPFFTASSNIWLVVCLGDKPKKKIIDLFERRRVKSLENSVWMAKYIDFWR